MYAKSLDRDWLSTAWRKAAAHGRLAAARWVGNAVHIRGETATVRHDVWSLVATALRLWSALRAAHIYDGKLFGTKA